MSQKKFSHGGCGGRIGILPPEGGGVVGTSVDVTAQLAGQIRGGGNDPSGDHVALQLREPDLHLIQPRRIRRRKVQRDIGVLVVPGGSSIRDGVYLAKSVVCMPPMYINVGAYVDEGSMVDSHALVGSCAQIGKNCHLSAAAQIGGVLEPIGAVPVVIEDGVMVGGNCGVYEGTIVRAGAVLGAGTVLTRSTPVYDIVHGVVHRADGDKPLVIPAGAVVVPGSRPITPGQDKEWPLSLAAPVIVKYRDAKTDQRVELEDLLR